ncbi:hypothetical protein MBLNU13_g09140t1 [Cladosporium sp. NU13]
MPYIARHQESTLTALEIAARNHLIHQGALQKHVIGTTPEHTSALRRISKDYLFPFSRHRVINGFLRKIDLFGRVQRARVALLNDDLESGWLLMAVETSILRLLAKNE